MTKRTVVYYWNGSTTENEWCYIEVDYDNKIYSTGNATSNVGFSSNVYLHKVPRLRDIKRHEQVLSAIGFDFTETFWGY